MTPVLQYQHNWEQYHELFEWSLPAWTPELAEFVTRLAAGYAPVTHVEKLSAIPAAAAGWVANSNLQDAQAVRHIFTAVLLDNEPANLQAASLTQAYHCNQWLGALGWLMASEPFDVDFSSTLLDSSQRLIKRLVAHLCPASMNWRIAEAAYLLRFSLALDFLEEAGDWQAWAVRAINDAVHRQINADGSHRERNPHYHIWMTRELTVLWRIGRAIPALGLRIPVARLAAMWDYAVFCNRPNGTENGLHDSRGWFEGRRPDLERQDRAAFFSEAGLQSDLPSPNGWFPDAGQALLRDSWDADAVYITFDATRWGESHCHYSRNSLQVHACGRTLLADPGVFEYADTPLGNYGRSTRAHSTINLNGWNQAQTDPSRTVYHHATGYDLVVSDYEGTFHPGNLSMVHPGDLGAGLWVSHHRCLLWVHGRAIVVIDSLVRVPDTNECPDAAPTLECNWQLGPGAAVWDDAARRLTTQHADSNLLMLFPAMPEGCHARLYEGEQDPPRGFMSNLYVELGMDAPNCGRPVSAPQLCLSLEPMLTARAEFVTLLVPFKGTTPPPLRAEARPATLQTPGYLLLQDTDGRIDTFTWSYRLDLGLGFNREFDTDAALLHVTHDQAHSPRGVAVDATYVRPYREDIAATPGLLTF